MKKTAAALSAFLALFLALPVFAAERFTVDDYTIVIDVSEDGVYSISESLDLDFHERSHGIFRDIQYVFSNIPGEFPYRAKVSGIEANVPWETDTEDGYCLIRLGDEDEYMEGKSSIDLSYDFTFRFDQSEKYDEFYYNIVSPAWDTVIRHVSFRINFPKPVSPDMIWLTEGWYGTANVIKGWSLSDDGMTVTGEFSGMDPYEALTLRVQMEEGYFAFPEVKSFVLPLTIAFIVTGMLYVLWSCFAWWKWGSDEELIVPVRFTPPEGMSPLECGYIVDGSVDFQSDILPMIFYWADKGLMTIEDRGDGDYVFTRTGDMGEEERSYEKKLFKWFFNGKDSVTTEDVVKGKFMEKSAKANEAVKKRFNEEGPLKDKMGDRMQLVTKILGFLEIIVFSIFISVDHLGTATMFLMFPSVIMFIVDSAFSHAYFKNWNVRTRAKNIVFVILAMIPNVIAGLLLAAFLTMFGLSWPLIILTAVVQNLCMIAASFIADACEKRSAYGNEVLSGVLGYREFLDKVEVEKLEALIEEDPAYFYHNLSYAACFGLTEKYVRKFQNLAYSQPDWLVGPAADYWYWSSISNGWRRQYMSRYAELNVPSGGSSTSSGFSGFSGGGFSGGGGRSW